MDKNTTRLLYHFDVLLCLSLTAKDKYTMAPTSRNNQEETAIRKRRKQYEFIGFLT